MHPFSLQKFAAHNEYILCCHPVHLPQKRLFTQFANLTWPELSPAPRSIVKKRKSLFATELFILMNFCCIVYTAPKNPWNQRRRREKSETRRKLWEQEILGILSFLMIHSMAGWRKRTSRRLKYRVCTLPRQAQTSKSYPSSLSLLGNVI